MEAFQVDAFHIFDKQWALVTAGTLEDYNTMLLSVLNLTNISLFFMYTVGTVAVFAVIYAIIYSITAREYYKIIICRGE